MPALGAVHEVCIHCCAPPLLFAISASFHHPHFNSQLPCPTAPRAPHYSSFHYPQFSSQGERDEWCRKEAEQLRATVAQKQENQRGAQEQLAAAQAEEAEVGGGARQSHGAWMLASFCVALACTSGVLAYPTCSLAPLLLLALVTHTVPTLVPIRCRSVWGSCASRWRSEKTAPSPRWSGRCANSVPLGLFEPPPRLTCSHDCSRRAPDLPALLCRAPPCPPQEQLRQQRSELQNTQRDLFQRESELSMWVIVVVGCRRHSRTAMLPSVRRAACQPADAACLASR